MKEKDFVVNGFLFSTKLDFNDAKQELEAIEHFTSKLNLSNPKEALKLYNKIIEKQSFRTTVGFDFLKQLQETILKSDVIKEEDLAAIKIPGEYKTSDGFDDLSAVSLNHYRELAETARVRNRNSRIINIFLVFIIIAMIVISINADKTVFTNYKNDLINNYETWQEELNAKEKELNEREAKLNELESSQQNGN